MSSILIKLYLSITSPSLPPPPLLFSSFLVEQDPDENFGMNIGGGKGGKTGDLPIFISDLRSDSVAWKSGQIQVRALPSGEGWVCVRE